jgi:hypothetical protein
MSYQSVVLADSPLAYWRMSEAAGATFADLSGNNFTGTLQSAGWTRGVASATSALGNAITLPGTLGVFGSVPSNTTVQPLTNCTYECWLNPSRVNVAQFAMGQDFNSTGTHVNGMAIRLAIGGQFQGSITWDGTVVVNSGATVASVGTWYYVVLTRTGNPGTWALYVNATLAQGGAVAPFGITQNDSVFGVGQLAPSTGSPFGGSLDEVAIYGTALSQAQVQAHYDARNSAPGGGSPVTSPPGAFVSALAHDRNAERKAAKDDQQTPDARRRSRLDYRRRKGG